VSDVFGAIPLGVRKVEKLIKKTIEEEHPGKKCPCAICLVMYSDDKTSQD